MNEAIRNLEPRSLWNFFADLNAVPRGSKKEARVIEFVKGFGEKRNLETLVDAVGNVIIRKPATPGMEDRTPIVMQSHLDMVHQKNNDTVFDFDTQGIEMMIDGDWVRANGTTLGADNGLGVATIMAILDSNSIAHPALEALFTIDEETGMTGAMGLKGGLLHGKILLNLDTEEDDELGVGCAGGVDVTAQGSYTEVSVGENSIGIKISLKGLQGGHSGMDIHKGLGNANKLMNRILQATCDVFHLSEVHGGSLRNAIPRESLVLGAVDKAEKGAFKRAFETIRQAILDEYKILEPELDISYSEGGIPAKVMDAEAQKVFLQAVYAAHNGVYRMSPAIEGLVEASNNIAKVLVLDGTIKIDCLTRSSVESSKMDVALSLKGAFQLAGYEVTFSGDYPGWAPNRDSSILKVMEGLYEKRHGTKPHVAACHAGLECGILGQNYPGMDMISFGPTIKGAHSPDERASIKSTQKFWEYVLEVLKNIPKA
ncbi:MAG TPA: aminoacyl-histidine dipeptidase [Flavobacteriaceae bacterium]|nr:aminoacyl-histidine dipeptidase [Flavobacteriaceae bacterium]MCB9212427.1 aminoacyl-histidine dipeptidase [Alteromonas sp.]HPF11703.1 aminoacyl-histidine dipeptidase [Flavobacteriaceae bacterium]HQU20178.1 aminoacyl-histidine dipeptidase [Flavobacteriaceae bacterium]HQU64733.1 aminoacyl-histidine dipeptidase [Flavobacteriaceae bacterium]